MLIAIRSSLESIKIIKFNRFERIEVSFDLEMCHYGNKCLHLLSPIELSFFFSGENVAQISTERMANVLVGLEIFSQSYQNAF